MSSFSYLTAREEREIDALLQLADEAISSRQTVVKGNSNYAKVLGDAIGGTLGTEIAEKGKSGLANVSGVKELIPGVSAVVTAAIGSVGAGSTVGSSLVGAGAAVGVSSFIGGPSTAMAAAAAGTGVLLPFGAIIVAGGLLGAILGGRASKKKEREFEKQKSRYISCVEKQQKVIDLLQKKLAEKEELLKQKENVIKQLFSMLNRKARENESLKQKVTENEEKVAELTAIFEALKERGSYLASNLQNA